MTSKFTVVVTRADRDVLEARQIRREVFVEEQGIPAHLDPDGFDDVAFHVLCRAGDEVVGTGRLVTVDGAKGVLARIAVLSRFRGNGVGRLIVQKLESVAIAEGLNTLSLQPHKHLEAFYQNLGYRTVPGTDCVAGHELITMQKDIGTTHSARLG